MVQDKKKSSTTCKIKKCLILQVIKLNGGERKRSYCKNFFCPFHRSRDHSDGSSAMDDCAMFITYIPTVDGWRQVIVKERFSLLLLLGWLVARLTE